jgi:hypothetical protein
LAENPADKKIHEMARAKTHAFNTLMQTLEGRDYQQKHFSVGIKQMHKRLDDSAKFYSEFTAKMRRIIVNNAPKEYHVQLNELMDMANSSVREVSDKVSTEAFLYERVLDLECALIREKLDGLNLINECKAAYELMEGNFRQVFPVVQNKVLLEQVFVFCLLVYECLFWLTWRFTTTPQVKLLQTLVLTEADSKSVQGKLDTNRELASRELKIIKLEHELYRLQTNPDAKIGELCPVVAQFIPGGSGGSGGSVSSGDSTSPATTETPSPPTEAETFYWTKPDFWTGM